MYLPPVAFAEAVAREAAAAAAAATQVATAQLATAGASGSTTRPEPAELTPGPTPTRQQLEALTVAELRNLCREGRKPVTGLKKDLVARLLE